MLSLVFSVCPADPCLQGRYASRSLRYLGPAGQVCPFGRKSLSPVEASVQPCTKYYQEEKSFAG